MTKSMGRLCRKACRNAVVGRGYQDFGLLKGRISPEDSNLNPYTRPWEPLAREPWWLFTTCWLIYKIKSNYQLSVKELLKLSHASVS